MKRAREAAAEWIGSECGHYSSDWSDDDTARVIREQQLAFGRRVLEDTFPGVDLPPADLANLERLVDEDGV